jgi:poly-beta-1,6-N-acetyl-D-glucosamine synthase
MLWILLIFLLPYLILIVRICLALAQVRLFIPDSSHERFVSVVIACRNEEHNLPGLVKHIADQDYRPDLFEVLLVDDNSDDKTFETATGLKNIQNLVVIHNSGKGKKAALRTGITAARGEIIITTDADCTMGRKWLSTIVSFFEERHPDLIISPVSPEGGKGLFHKFQELEFLSLQGITAGSALSRNPVMCNGANLAFTKELYLQCSHSLHDELPGGDDIFLLHAAKKDPGKVISWLESHEAMVFTGTRPSLKSFLSQRARWISKAGSYNDGLTILTGLVTFMAIILEMSLLIAAIFVPVLLKMFFVAFMVKTAADSCLLFNTARRYGKKSLLFIVPLAEIIYPFYVTAVILFPVFSGTQFKKVWS